MVSARAFFWQLLLLATGCSHTVTGETALSDDTAAPTWGPEWTVGPEEPCDAPVDAAWTDASAAWVGSTDAWPDATTITDQQGCLSVVQDSTGDLLLETTPDGLVGWRSGAVAGTLDGPTWDGRLYLQDLDADGRDDLVVSNKGLAIADGVEGAFLAVIGAVGDTGSWDPVELPLTAAASPGAVAALDADGDGVLDLFVAHTQPQDGALDPPALYRGLAGGGFADATAPLGSDLTWGTTFDVTSWDWDGDGDLDLYRCNDGGQFYVPNSIVLNNGDGTFVEADSHGLDVAIGCMGSAVADLDGDGLLDVYLSEYESERLMMGSPDGWYDATSARIDLVFVDQQMAWGAAQVDLDNDGYPDIVSGTSDDHDPTLTFPLLYLHGAADGTFTESGAAYGLPRNVGARGVVSRDLNGDGVRDVVIGDWTRPPWVFASTGCTADGWLEVEAPSGTRVTVEGGGRTWTTFARTHDGYCGTGSSVAHVGVGALPTVDRVTLDVPGWGPSVLTGPLSVRRRLRWAG